MKLLMLAWESNPAFRTMTREVAKENKDVFNDFLGHVLTDLNFCVEEGFQDIPKYKELYEKGESNLTDEEQGNLKNFEDKIKNWFKNGRDLLKSLVYLTTIFADEFSGDDWRKKFVNILNYYAKKFMTKYFKTLQMRIVSYGSVNKINVFKALGINVLETIKQLLRVYINVSDNQVILEEIVKDERSYEDGLLIDLGKTALKKKLLFDNDITKLEALIEKLRGMAAEASNLKAILDDYPEEYMCQLTYELMTDPVKLPASNIVVDRSAIKQHISLNGETDPFNRQPLTLADLEEQPDLKKKVDDWIKEQLDKAKDKVNIQQHAEEDEEDTVFDDVEEVQESNSVFKPGF